jgi:putative ABC transport system ATP-binding protein
MGRITTFPIALANISHQRFRSACIVLLTALITLLITAGSWLGFNLRNSKIGYIPQGNSLLQNFTVLDNVCLPWYLTRKDDIKNFARELFAKVGVASLERESPCNLSGGEARRVAIARSLVTNPKILFADEPTSDLDPAAVDDVIHLFAEINSQGVAVIIVTHERQIPLCANRHLVMDNGQLWERKTV